MSAVLDRPAAPPPAQPEASEPRRWWRFDRRGPVPPTLVSLFFALGFVVVRPDVSDLQAALARQSAASHGVGLSYWFQWFGGGATPGSYSVLTPYLSTVLGAVVVGALATVAITPLSWFAFAGTPHRLAGTWVATYAFGISLWSGRVPFALGCAFGVAAVLAFRQRRWVITVLAILLSCLSSPVCGAFVAFGFGSAALVDVAQRKAMLYVCAINGVLLVAIAWYFGAPGNQGYPVASIINATLAAIALLIARPAPNLRIGLYIACVAPLILSLFPNGMGTNFNRYTWLVLPAAVAATATGRRYIVPLAIALPLSFSTYQTVVDLRAATRPAASPAYYTALIRQLDGLPNLPNCRLEVVQDPQVHTAANTLIEHVALAGGWETQEAHTLNGILEDKARLNADTYKIWLDNNAVCYVAYNVNDNTPNPEYKLVGRHDLPYLRKVSQSGPWELYSVENWTPIVALPEVLVDTSQASMTISVSCACTFNIRVRYSDLLTASDESGTRDADVTDDGTGWTTITTTAPGMYVLRGQIGHRLK